MDTASESEKSVLKNYRITKGYRQQSVGFLDDQLPLKNFNAQSHSKKKKGSEKEATHLGHQEEPLESD
jgi:hypothetical protein